MDIQIGIQLLNGCIIENMYRHSSISTYKQCAYKYKLQYVDELKTIYNQDPQNALTIGNLIHYSVEHGLQYGVNWYKSNYNLITDLHINEIMKVEELYPKLTQTINRLGGKIQHEFHFETAGWQGTIDLLIDDDAIYDIKYSNNVDNYLESAQLHIYKHFMENLGYKINKLGFIFVPKTFIRQKKTEDLYQFRQRLLETLSNLEVRVEHVEYDKSKVIECLEIAKNKKTYEKRPTRLCDWCEYQDYCEKGDDVLILPKNEKKEKVIISEPDIWIYGDSYIGKSTFVDSFDDVLFINTDGNTDTYTSANVIIKDEVTFVGRLTNTKLAWDVFLETVIELEKKENSFKIIALDLKEDLFEHCRLYIYQKHKIQHEQDAGFGKGWDLVKTEYNSTMKRLKHLGYRLFYISKEVATETTDRSGKKTTTYKPNISDKIANVMTGLVDLTIRAYIDNDKRLLLLQKSDDVFGGGRFDFRQKTVELERGAFEKAIKESQENKRKVVK